MTRPRSYAAALALLLPGPAAAQAPPPAASPPPAAPAARVEFVADTLPNGLRVVYHVDRSTPVAAVDVWYNVGAKNEQQGRTGFAHLFEHMMFKGSRNVADGQHWALLEAAGGRAGADINGTTSTDRTNYFEQVPSNQLDLALWLEADRMATLIETVDQKKLDNQREVVKNERRQSIDNQPYGTWFERMFAEAFPVSHPYNHAVIGSMTDLSAASLDDVRQFFRTYYAPNNAVLAIAGDIDVAQARQLVRKRFGAIARGPAVPPLASMAVPPLIGSAKRAEVPDQNAPAPAVYVGFRVPPARDPAAPTATLLASVIADGKSSPLYRTLVRERQLAANVFGGTVGLVDGADLMVFAATGRPGTDPKALEAALLAVVNSARQSLTQAELDRARAGARFQFTDALQGTGGFGGRADQLAMGAVFYGDPNWVNTVLPKFDRVTVADLQRLAAERLVSTNRVTLVYLPDRPGAKVVP